jgi:hypothetical protein
MGFDEVARILHCAVEFLTGIFNHEPRTIYELIARVEARPRGKAASPHLDTLA